MAEIDGEGIELSLGLSLNGRFGVDPKTNNPTGNLLRSSSSISSLLETAAQSPQLARTSSLPVEAEDETRKRKEVQMLRRLEAKRKRSEKRNTGGGGSGLVNGIGIGFGFGLKPEKGNGSEEVVNVLPPLSQASSGSSGLSELDSTTPPPPPSGMNKGIEAKSPQSVHSFSEQTEKRHGTSTTNEEGIRGNTTTEIKRTRTFSGTNEMVRDMLTDMPCVSTKGDGPNGRKIEGFLYRYRKGEEVRIVCVCHGSFLSPAEFVKHAGGGDVENPLRHIVVNPSPFI